MTIVDAYFAAWDRYQRDAAAEGYYPETLEHVAAGGRLLTGATPRQAVVVTAVGSASR